MFELLSTFLLAFGSLVPIVNPPGSAFLFLAATPAVTPDERARLAARIACYALVVILVSMYLGAWALTFFGISLPALRLGGGIILAMSGWQLINRAPGFLDGEVPKPSSQSVLLSAFYPLTMPLTTGPGTIAATIALGTSPSVGGMTSLGRLAGPPLAALTIAVMIYVCYRFADRLATVMGRTLADALMRVFALFLICIGVEVMLGGLGEFLGCLER